MFEKLKTPQFRGVSTLAFALVASGLLVARAKAAEAAQSATAAATPGASQTVDDSALRYYASNGQAIRADAEMRRLRALYPNWAPPEGLGEKAAAGGGEEEDDLWDLFASNRLDELRAAIESRRAAEPGWEPSADLRGKFRAKMFRVQVAGLAKDQRYGDLVSWLRSSRPRLEGVDVDVLWTVAEAYQKTHMNDQALEIYKGILSTNSVPAERLTTVQKSLASLRLSEVEQLLAMAHKDATGNNEFAPIATDIARARIAAFLHDERREEVPDSDILQFSTFARKANDSNQPALLAWYYYKLKRPSLALDWFKFALGHGGDAMVAHGLALTLRSLGMKREAEEVAYAWREPLVNNSILFIDILETDLTKAIPPFVEPERLARYGEVTLATASGQGAQALAWYAYNSCQFDVALQWFERAVAWHPKEPTTYGYALTLRRMKKRAEATNLVNRYDGLFPKVLEILFPNGRQQPPTPCEANAQRMSYAQAAPLGLNAPQSANGVLQDPSRQYAWGRVASPGHRAYGFSMDAMPKISRAEFPIRVTLENPIRFAPVGQAPIVNVTVGGNPPAAVGGFAREPAPWMSPLVARRVPGAGSMPYERYGFALLPGYNGVTTVSSPSASQQSAPAGTLWSLEPRNDASPEASSATRVDTLPPAAGPAPMPTGQSAPRMDPMRNG